MGRTARTELQCLYKGALYLYFKLHIFGPLHLCLPASYKILNVENYLWGRCQGRWHTVHWNLTTQGCGNETFGPAYYDARILELSEIFAELLPKMSAGDLKTDSGNVTHLTGKIQRNQTTMHIRISTCSVSVYSLWVRQEVSRMWSVDYKQPFDLMNNGGICPRTYSKYGNLARLIWRWLMDWYLNFNAGQCKFRTDVQGCSAKSVFKVGNVLTRYSQIKRARRNSTSNLTCFRTEKSI